MYRASGWHGPGATRGPTAPTAAAPTLTESRSGCPAAPAPRRPPPSGAPRPPAAGCGAAGRSRPGAARPRDDAIAPCRTGGHPGLAEGAGRRAHGRPHAHGDRPGHARRHEGLQRRRAVRKGAVAGELAAIGEKDRSFRTAGQVDDPQGVGGGGPRGTAGCGSAMVGNRETDRAGARGGRQAHPGRQPERRGTPGTVAPGDHATGAPVGVPGHGDDGGEPAVMHGLPERSDIRGRAITPGALHTVRATARPGTERRDAACVFTGRASAPETHATPARIDRERDGQCDGDVDRAHGRTGQRRTGVPTPGPGTVTWPGIRRVARVRRRRESVLPGDAGKPGTGTFHSTTSPGAEAASPRDLPAPTAVTGPWRARPTACATRFPTGTPAGPAPGTVRPTAPARTRSRRPRCSPTAAGTGTSPKPCAACSPPAGTRSGRSATRHRHPPNSPPPFFPSKTHPGTAGGRRVATAPAIPGDSAFGTAE